MNTFSGTGCTFFKATLFFFLSFFTLNGFAQTQRKRVDTVQVAYFAALKKHLYPPVDSLTTRELALFVVFPEVEPNSSLRLIDKNGKTYLEVRSLEKNLWVETLTSFANHSYTPINLKVNVYSTIVSQQFANNMVEAFNEVIARQNSQPKPEPYSIYDGTIYDFSINDNGKIASVSINADVDSTDVRMQVVTANLQIITDLKNDSFDQSKYQIYN
jgi:hypothetical protein